MLPPSALPYSQFASGGGSAVQVWGWSSQCPEQCPVMSALLGTWWPRAPLSEQELSVHLLHFITAWIFCLSCRPPPPQLTVGLTVSVLSAGQTGAAGLAGSCRAAWLGWVPWLRGQTWAVWAAWRAGECCVMLPRPHGDPRECRAGSCCGARSTPSFVSAGAAGLPWGPGAGW